jgi:hypothetical protein
VWCCRVYYEPTATAPVLIDVRMLVRVYCICASLSRSLQQSLAYLPLEERITVEVYTPYYDLNKNNTLSAYM